MQTSNRSLQVVGRIATALLGGYVVTWGYAVLGVAGLAAVGVPYSTAYAAVMLISFLVFLIAFLWAFVAPSLARVAIVLVGSGSLMTLMAWWLQRSMI